MSLVDSSAATKQPLADCKVARLSCHEEGCASSILCLANNPDGNGRSAAKIARPTRKQINTCYPLQMPIRVEWGEPRREFRLCSSCITSRPACQPRGRISTSNAKVAGKTSPPDPGAKSGKCTRGCKGQVLLHLKHVDNEFGIGIL